MDLPLLAALFAAAAAGGALNSVAGGGTFLTFPMLLFAGVSPIRANATSTVALWPGSVASAYGYRDEIRHEPRLVAWLACASAVGGIIGAVLLLKTPEQTFRTLIPWLLLTATVIFAFGTPLARRLGARRGRPGRGAWAGLAAGQFAVAIYGGYFGGGIGILMLAAFALMGMQDVHSMNGLKAILGSIVNGLAIVAFAAARIVVWPMALVMLVGGLLGGYGGARYARRVPQPILRGIIVAVGATLSAYYFWRTYA
ncbi:MAG: sulfite exporter TauE/SafE family protein [Thermoplasmatota archaeon]